MIIMLFKGTSSLFFYYLIFGIIHGDPAWEGRLGIPGQNCQLERLQQGAGTGKGDEATRAGWHVHMTTATSLPSVSTQGTAHLDGRKGWKQLPRGAGVGWGGGSCDLGTSAEPAMRFPAPVVQASGSCGGDQGSPSETQLCWRIPPATPTHSPFLFLTRNFSLKQIFWVGLPFVKALSVEMCLFQENVRTVSWHLAPLAFILCQPSAPVQRAGPGFIWENAVSGWTS